MWNGLGAAALVAIPVSCLLYLIWAGARRGSRDRTTLAYARSSVKFHGLWGMVLSMPLVFAGVATSFGGNADWSGQLLLAATLGCWSVAILAMLGRRVPAPFTWLPLVLVSVVLLAAPSGSESFGQYFFWFVVYSLAGVGLAAWVLVSVNFALAVRKLKRMDATTRTPERVGAGTNTGFVWPV